MGLVTTVLLILLASFVLFALYRISREYTVQVFCGPKMKQIIDKMQSHLRKYKPTPWLFNRHFHSVYAMAKRSTPKILDQKDQREEISFPDGGMAMIDWFFPDNPKPDTPIVVICHTLGGSNRDKCVRNTAFSLIKKGWKVCVPNCRGAGGGKILTDKIYNAYDISDLRYVIETVVKPKNPSHIFLLGFSMGSMHVVHYADDFGDLDACAAISHPIDGPAATHLIESKPGTYLYLPAILGSLKKTMGKINPRTPVLEKALHCKTLHEVDDIFTAPSLGLPDHLTYYKTLTLSKERIDQLKCPTLVMVAKDDPMIDPELIPYEDIRQSQNLVLMMTEEGGHVGFLEGKNAQKSFIDDVIIEWFEMNQK